MIKHQVVDVDSVLDIPDVKVAYALNDADLSFNELSTLWLLSTGLNNTQIAERLHLSKMAITKILRRCTAKLEPYME